MFDAPETPAPHPATDETLHTTASFSTYLMYQPLIQGSVWIAISQVNWSWDVQGTNDFGTWLGAMGPVDTIGPMTPYGSAAFPMWVNTAQSFVSTLIGSDHQWGGAKPGNGA